jgi:hypothetical protein
MKAPWTDPGLRELLALAALAALGFGLSDAPISCPNWFCAEALKHVACCGVVRNVCCDGSAPRGAAFNDDQQLDERECHGATSALCAPPPPPGEKATARQDQARHSGTDHGAGDARN